jgi:hypothetical protein
VFERRTLLQVTVESAVEAAETFQDLMGHDVESRRNFIQKNAKFVVNLDVPGSENFLWLIIAETTHYHGTLWKKCEKAT